MNCNIHRNKRMYTFQCTNGWRDFLAYLVNVFRPRELCISGKIQRFSMVNSPDRPVIDTYINLLNLCLDLIIISSVLATFKLNLLALSQQVRLLSSEVTASLRSTTIFADKVILVSLANILGAATRRQLGRSLMYIEKSKGPRMLPCSTPQVTVLAVHRLPFTLHLWVWLLRYDWNHLAVAWSAPK